MRCNSAPAEISSGLIDHSAAKEGDKEGYLKKTTVISPRLIAISIALNDFIEDRNGVNESTVRTGLRVTKQKSSNIITLYFPLNLEVYL